MSPRKVPLALRIEPDLLERVDKARGDVSRTRWVERALESALEVGIAHPEGTPVPAHPRAPVKKEQPGPKVAPREPAAATVKKPDSRRTPSLKDTWGR